MGKSASKQFAEEVLQCHNEYRKKHQAPALKLNSKLSREAARYAESLASTRILKHSEESSRGSCGENLAWASYDQSGKDVADRWYDEVKQYNFNSPGFSSGTVHARPWLATHLPEPSPAPRPSAPDPRRPPEATALGRFCRHAAQIRSGRSGPPRSGASGCCPNGPAAPLEKCHKDSMIALTSCDSPRWMESCSMEQLAASNTTTLPPLRPTHSLGFISSFESSHVN
ncbi:GLI pathogenesis-related 2, like isoform X1 [Phycodurus eques]|uniref:GLI pathogenesis-related 2, like isoform X1 n=1 Tax=Phycodurus eques TaxID=693459 RepID=UPI002ACE72D7|nr:GLI pathogenesis-related 2, like isoform X1 [Phycodurus eques]